MKKAAALLVLGVFVFSTAMIFAETTKDRLSSGMNNLLYGQVEVPKNLNETKSKGAKAFDSCTDKTKDGVARGIARTVGGVWKILTFWNADVE